MYAMILCAALGMSAELPIARDTVDVIEVNHFFDAYGRLVFNQIIFWEWIDEESAYRVVAWRFVKRAAQLPHRHPKDHGYISIWLDGDHLRQVRSLSRRETWTQFDPEVEDRKYVPQNQRRGLLKRPR